MKGELAVNLIVLFSAFMLTLSICSMITYSICREFKAARAQRIGDWSKDTQFGTLFNWMVDIKKMVLVSPHHVFEFGNNLRSHSIHLHTSLSLSPPFSDADLLTVSN